MYREKLQLMETGPRCPTRDERLWSALWRSADPKNMCRGSCIGIHSADAEQPDLTFKNQVQ
jgi:hypothetical protein